MVHRVFVIASWYPSMDQPARGVFVEEQAVALSDRYQVVVIAPELRQWREHLAGPDGRVEVKHQRGLNIVRVKAIPVFPRNRRARFSAYLNALERAYLAAVGQFGPADLLHAHIVLPGGWAAARVAHRYGIPMVLTEHSGPFAMHLGHSLDRQYAQWTLRQANVVVAVSPVLRERIIEFSPMVDVKVLGNVVDTDFFTPGPEEAGLSEELRFRILSVGLLAASKGMDRVLDAVAVFVELGHRQVELTIVGDGPERSALEARATRLGIADRCRFLGTLDRSGIRDEMRRCDVFVLASDSETFGVVIAEAMACGRPVVATRSGGADYVVEPGAGILVPVGDIEAIVAALADLAERRVVVDGAAARRSIIRRFGRRAFLEGIRSVYAGAMAASDRD